MNQYINVGKKVLSILEENGYEAYFIGGTSRDILLGKDVSDIDITTNALPHEVIVALSSYQISNKDGLYYGTVKYNIDGIEVEITTFRKEGMYVRSRRPISVDFIKDKEVDSIRRDFTINALYMDARGNVFDYHDGLKDLKEGMINTIGDPLTRFKEDALRIIRAIRFSLSLNMILSEEVKNAIKENAYLINDLKESIVKREINKMKQLKTNEELDKIFKELNIEWKEW